MPRKMGKGESGRRNSKGGGPEMESACCIWTADVAGRCGLEESGKSGSGAESPPAPPQAAPVLYLVP